MLDLDKMVAEAEARLAEQVAEDVAQNRHEIKALARLRLSWLLASQPILYERRANPLGWIDEIAVTNLIGKSVYDHVSKIKLGDVVIGHYDFATGTIKVYLGNLLYYFWRHSRLRRGLRRFWYGERGQT